MDPGVNFTLHSESVSGNASTLLVFDFDNTLINGNTDYVAIEAHKLLPGIAKYSENPAGWAATMSSVLGDLYKHGIKKLDLQHMMANIPLIDGISNIIEVVKMYQQSDDNLIAICSHANTFFIEAILESNPAMKEVFTNVQTYHATFIDSSEGPLVVNPYYTGDPPCCICPIDFCKGLFIKRLKAKLKEEGKSFERVVYVGDGSADYCAGLSMGNQDFMLCRSDYKMHRRILTDDGKEFKANYLVWRTGCDVAKFLKFAIGRTNEELLKYDDVVAAKS